MKFLHTADLHLGRSFKLLGKKGESAREVQWETFERITALCRGEGVDFLLIAGDLFDSNEVSARLADRVARTLQGLAPIRVFILPGTHDVLDEGSIYRRESFNPEGSNICVFGIHGATNRVGKAAVHGHANTTKQGGVHPLPELTSDPEAVWNVAAIHASLTIEGKHSPDDYLVDAAEIDAAGMDYVALGHWHGEYRLPTQSTAWYSGAPEATGFGEKAGSVLLVTLGEGTAVVESREVGRLRWQVADIDVALHPPGGPLEKAVADLAGPDVILRAKLCGTWPPDASPDTRGLEEDYSPDFFHLEVNDAGTSFPLEDVEDLFPAGTVGARFVESLHERIASAASEEERALLQEALYTGAGMIAGKRG